MCTDNGWLTKTGLILGWQGSRKHVAEILIVGKRTILSWRHCLGSPTAGLKISAVCGWYSGGWVSIQLSTYFEKQAFFDDMIWKGCVNIVFGNFQMTWEFCFATFIAKFEQGTFKQYRIFRVNKQNLLPSKTYIAIKEKHMPVPLDIFYAVAVNYGLGFSGYNTYCYFMWGCSFPLWV